MLGADVLQPGAVSAARGPVTLSICIATFNRGAYIAATIQSIACQLIEGVELLVVDGASTDNTAAVVAPLCAAIPSMRYIREPVNSGVDADYDKAVAYAQGSYCWLMTDDDLLAPGAVARVLDALRDGPDAVITNAQVCTKDFSASLVARSLPLAQDRVYAGHDEQFLVDCARHLSFIGAVIIRRDRWLERERRSYYGTVFIHVGVLYQSPSLGRIKVLADPLIRIRYGNAMWTARGFEIWMFKWPQLIWSFDHYSQAARAKVWAREPWRSTRKLLLARAVGSYSPLEYRQHLAGKSGTAARWRAMLVAWMPATAANALAALYFAALGARGRATVYDLSRSRHANWVSKWIAGVQGLGSASS